MLEQCLEMFPDPVIENSVDQHRRDNEVPVAKMKGGGVARYPKHVVNPVDQPGNGKPERKGSRQRHEIADPAPAAQCLMEEKTRQNKVGSHKGPAGPRLPVWLHGHVISYIRARDDRAPHARGNSGLPGNTNLQGTAINRDPLQIRQLNIFQAAHIDGRHLHS